jgi:hypothetical protein
MERNDLIGTLSSYCEEHNIIFLPGAEYLQNIDISNVTINVDQYILSVMFECDKTVSNNRVTDRTYNGVMRLGRKLEVNTMSTLDETYLQKYSARLLDLENALEDLIQTIACENELLIKNYKTLSELNKFDENLDFVVAQIQLVQ